MLITLLINILHITKFGKALKINILLCELAFEKILTVAYYYQYFFTTATLIIFNSLGCGCRI